MPVAEPPGLWHLEGATVAAILGMAAATYLCRAGGYWLFRRVTPGPLLRRMLAHVPGTLFVAYVVPTLLAGGRQQWVGAAATLAVMLRLRSLPWAIVAGTAAAWVTWHFR
jgi:uncharacterized membrane protein